MSIEKVGAWRIESIEDFRSRLVPCRDQSTVHISRTCECRRFAWRGVPAKSCDVIIDRRILEQEAESDDCLVVTLSRKSGKYDHSIRDRWMVRRMKPSAAARLPLADLFTRVAPDNLSILIVIGVSLSIKRQYDRLPEIDAAYRQWDCVRRNWTRYFRHLDWSQVESAEAEFSEMPIAAGDTISELNMHCSRWLTDLSYTLGWQRWIQAAADRKGKPLWNRAEDADQSGGRYETAEEYFERVESELSR